MSETKPTWSGKLLDANGRTGTIDLDVVEQGGRGVGTWRVRLAERGGKTTELTGRVEFTATETGVVLRSGAGATGPVTGPGAPGTGPVPVETAVVRPTAQFQEGQTLEWEARLEREEAGLYARAAMLGEYRVSQRRPEFALSRGVMVLWQFS